MAKPDCRLMDELRSGNLDLAQNITKQLEAGPSAMLEQVMLCTSGRQERSQVLSLVQGLNAAHRLQDSAHIPALVIEERPPVIAASPWSKTVLNKIEPDSHFGRAKAVYVEEHRLGYGGENWHILKAD